MIITRLRGGLGNQMFQYAAGRAAALQKNTALFVDTTWFSSAGALNPRREYDLGIFTAEPHIASRWQIFVSKLTGTYLDGFWQDENYFRSIEKTVREDFTFRNPIPAQSAALFASITAAESVCINVRRDDFIKDGKFVGVSYYERGVEEILKTKPAAAFFVFSDDIEWCRTNLGFIPRATFVGHEHAGPKFRAYLQLMTACKHFIIPNSTFGWWAAWLSPHPDKTIIVPKEWSQGGGISTNDIIPAGWIKL
jgi:hypothetical protein